MFFQESQISIEFFREFIFALHLCHICLPARQFCIYRLHTFSDIIWEIINFLAIYLISNTSLDGIECIEHVALHHDQFGNTVYHNGIFQSYQVNPSATTFTSCYRTEFMSQCAHLVTSLVEQFCRERTGTYTSTVCLEDTEHLADTVRSYSQTGAGTCTNRIGRSNKRIRTEINIKHRSLSTFAKNALAVFQIIVNLMLTVYKMELFQIFDTFHPCFFQFCEVIFVVQTFQDLFVTSFRRTVFLFEVMKDITYTNTVTANFIRISRANAFTGCSYFRISLGCFVSSVQYAVCRKDEMSFLRNVQTLFQWVSRCFECLSFRFEQCRIEHYTVTDNIYLISLKNTGRNRTKYILLSFELKCMTGIRTALKTSDHIVLRC